MFLIAGIVLISVAGVLAYFDLHGLVVLALAISLIALAFDTERREKYERSSARSKPGNHRRRRSGLDKTGD